MLRKKIKIRLLKEIDAKLFREVRLEALQDSPDSFGRKYEEEKERPISYWEELINKNIDTNIIFAAFNNKKIIGTIFCFCRENKEGGFGGIWVNPNYRHQGIALALAKKGITWAKGKKLEKITLWNTEINEAAKNLYMKLGFQPTEDEKPLESNEELKIRKWEKIL